MASLTVIFNKLSDHEYISILQNTCCLFELFHQIGIFFISKTFSKNQRYHTLVCIRSIY